MNKKEMEDIINALNYLDFSKMDLVDSLTLMTALLEFSEKIKPIVVKYGIKEFMEQKT